MNQDVKITYTYQNKETGNRLQRTFSISEIKAGEDDAHMAIIPGYELEKVECNKCAIEAKWRLGKNEHTQKPVATD